MWSKGSFLFQSGFKEGGAGLTGDPTLRARKRAQGSWIFPPSDQTLKFNCYCKPGRGGVLKELACSTSESTVLPCPVLFVD